MNILRVLISQGTWSPTTTSAIKREEGRTRSSTGIHTCAEIVLVIIIVIIMVIIIWIIMVIMMIEMIDHTFAVYDSPRVVKQLEGC